MKDATGELSMTAVAVVAIAAISVLFSTLIWPQIKKTIMRSTYCSSAFGCGTPDDSGMSTCYFCESDDDADAEDVASFTNCSEPQEIQCNKN